MLSLIFKTFLAAYAFLVDFFVLQ